MKQLVTISIVFIGLIALILGPMGAWRWISEDMDAEHGQPLDNTSDSALIAMAEKELMGMQEALDDANVKLIRLDRKLKAEIQVRQELKIKWAKKRAILAKGKELLSAGDDPVEHEGKQWSRKQIANSLEPHIVAFHSIQSQWKTKTTTIEILKRTYKESKKDLQKAQATLMEKQAEFEAIKIRLASSRNKEDIQALQESMHGLGASEGTLGLITLQQRLSRLDATLGQDTEGSSLTALVGKYSGSPEDVLNKLEFLPVSPE